MSTLNSILAIASGSLQAEQSALDVSTNNIANSNTPGYSREVVNLTESATSQQGNSQMGTGVTFAGYQSVRDEVLQLQINNVTQQSNYSLAQSNALQQVEVAFSNTTDNIGTNITALFNSLSQLSTNPADSSLRQSVLSNAGNVANSFHAAAASFSQLQTGLDQTVPKSVTEINQLSTQIADLNAQIVSMKESGQNTGALEDKRDQLINELSKITNVRITQTPEGKTITTGNSTPLVVGNQAFSLSTATGSDGLQHVFQNGQDVTSSLTGGSLGGTLDVRDTEIPALQTKLSDLASQFSSAMNTANQSGYDLNGAQGGAMFSVAGTGPNAAANIQVALTSASQIAASSDGTVGSGGNLQNLLAVNTTKLPSGMTPLDAYSDLEYQVGNASAQAQSNNNADNAALSQLQTQQSSVSGVSLDEETTNLIRYQQAYQAAAKVVSTINSLYNTLIGMTTT